MNKLKNNERSLLFLAWLALFVLAMSLFMGKAYQQSLQAMDSSIHARLALDATSSGIKPVLPIRTLDGGFNQGGFNDHPFFLFYVNGWLMRLFGADAWSARFLPSLFGVGCVGLLAWLGTLLYAPVHGLVAGFILLFSLPFANYAARFQLDPAMIFFILLSFIGWLKRKPLVVGISAGLSLWMKNPVGLLIFPSAFLCLTFLGKLNKKEFRFLLVSSFLALLVGSLVWVLAGLFGGWEMVSDYWKRQVFGTAVGGRGYQQSYELFLFTEALKRRYWPWLPLLLFSLFTIFKTRRWKIPAVALPLAATLVVILAISSMRFKFDHYYLPMYPFLALLCVDPLRAWIERNKRPLLGSLIGVGLVLPSFLLAFPIELSPEMFPALRKFSAIIQSYGTCRDKVLYIDGFQPYGSYGDYSVEIAYYTNHPFIGVDCGNANNVIKAQNPGWVIVFGKNLEACLDDSNKARYPVRYQFGNQYLLTNLIPVEKASDLTPLARELKAPLDCNPVPLPRNRYYRYE